MKIVATPAVRPRSDPVDAPLAAVRAVVRQAIRGKDDVIELALCCLVAGGHLLLEDVPGVGKSTLAQALARAVGGAFRRVQFTSDLLPADLLGVNVWRAHQEQFEFKPGPVFANFVLADEINRAPPRTQSALLEAMGEQQITVDGHTYHLPAPFMVLATQNPSEHYGTYALPESQRDRFLMRVSLGYAPAEVEVEILHNRDQLVARLSEQPVVTLEQVVRAQAGARVVELHADLARYAQRVVETTRVDSRLRLGVSTRGAIGWISAARARAYLSGREFVSPDDLQELAVCALAHRVVPAHAPPGAETSIAIDIISELLGSIPIPM